MSYYRRRYTYAQQTPVSKPGRFELMNQLCRGLPPAEYKAKMEELRTWDYQQLYDAAYAKWEGEQFGD